MAIVTLGSKPEGSIVKIKENGKLVDFYVAKQNYESGLNGTGRVLVVRKDCYDTRQWNSSVASAYATSSIDTWLNDTYKNLLDSNIRTQMGTTTFYYTIGNLETSKTTLKRAVFLLSATELGKYYTYLNIEGTELSSTVRNLLKIAKLNGSAVFQWTRSPNITGNSATYALDTNGDLRGNICTTTYGSRPAFTLPATIYVSDDGSVTVNTAPSMPASITIPTTINGGTDITVSWGASTDTEGNLSGYKVEKSITGGSSWSQIYQGTVTNTKDAVAFGTNTVMYRVKAYDTEGLESGWRTSSQTTVVNNRAPGAPASITVPLTVNGGASLVISWGAATDSDGNLSGYELERQYNGGSWSRIYQGANLSYTDTITKGWTSVAYRVRAYDALAAYSSYTTSPTRTVNNNTAPVFTCDKPSGSDLGMKTSGFEVGYSVDDVDGDTVTVTETIDGVTKRSYQAALKQNYSFQVTGETFMKLLNGSHTLGITANDGKASTVHKLTVTKEVTAASITLEEPLEADDKITICVLSVSGFIPADATYTVEVTNNAKDDTPVWEDCTVEVKNGVNHIFTNETAEKGFAFNFRVNVSRGASGQGGYITSVQGGFQ